MASWSGLTITCFTLQKRKFITFFANYIQRYLVLGTQGGYQGIVQVGLFDQAKHIVDMQQQDTF
jgi:hypothetical protein